MRIKRKTFADANQTCVKETVPEIKWEDIRDQVPAGQEFSAAIACLIFRCLKEQEKKRQRRR